MATRSFSVDLAEWAWDQFDDFASETGYTKTRLIQSAVLLIQCMPPSIRELLNKGKFEEVGELLESGSADFTIQPLSDALYRRQASEDEEESSQPAAQLDGKAGSDKRRVGNRERG